MTYTAPQTVPVNPCGIVVTATSNEDNVTAGQALVNVSAAPSYGHRDFVARFARVGAR